MACPFMTYPLSVWIRLEPPGETSPASGAVHSYFSLNRLLCVAKKANMSLIPYLLIHVASTTFLIHSLLL